MMILGVNCISNNESTKMVLTFSDGKTETVTFQ
jgi:hypothetical protein